MLSRDYKVLLCAWLIHDFVYKQPAQMTSTFVVLWFLDFKLQEHFFSILNFLFRIWDPISLLPRVPPTQGSTFLSVWLTFIELLYCTLNWKINKVEKCVFDHMALRFKYWFNKNPPLIFAGWILSLTFAFLFCVFSYTGWRYDRCPDVDECSLNIHQCLGNSTCQNTDGSYKCPCDQGFEGDGKIQCNAT